MNECMNEYMHLLSPNHILGMWYNSKLEWLWYSPRFGVPCLYTKQLQLIEVISGRARCWPGFNSGFRLFRCPCVDTQSGSAQKEQCVVGEGWAGLDAGGGWEPHDRVRTLWNGIEAKRYVPKHHFPLHLEWASVVSCQLPNTSGQMVYSYFYSKTWASK